VSHELRTPLTSIRGSLGLLDGQFGGPYGLDVVSGEFVRDAIRRARQDRRAVLLSTHIMDEATDLCDRIALLVRGRIQTHIQNLFVFCKANRTAVCFYHIYIHAYCRVDLLDF